MIFAGSHEYCGYSLMIQITRIGGDPETEIKEARFQVASFPPHFHDTYSIGLITQGLEDILHEGVEKTVCKGKIVVFNAGEVHANRCHDEDPWTYRTLNVNEDRIRHVARKNGIPLDGKPAFDAVIDDWRLVEHMESLGGVKTPDAIETMERIIIQLLLHHRRRQEKIPGGYAALFDIVEEIKEIIAGDLFDPPNLKTLAVKFNRSAFQIHRAFKSHTGLSPGDYKTLLRLNRAKKLIRQGCVLTEVGMDCGFYDQSHFIHTFRRFLGVTPRMYRDSISTC